MFLYHNLHEYRRQWAVPHFYGEVPHIVKHFLMLWRRPLPWHFWIRPDGVKLNITIMTIQIMFFAETGVLTIKCLDIVDDGQRTVRANTVKRKNSATITIKGTSSFSLTAPSTSSVTTITTTFWNILATNFKSRGVSATVVCLTVHGSLVLVISIVVFFL